MNTASEKPRYLDVCPGQIPEALTSRPQWVCWRASKEPKTNGKPWRWAKKPINPESGHLIDPTSPGNWSAFNTCLASFQIDAGTPGGPDGIGFALAEGGGLVGVDLDKCVDTDGTIASWAMDIVRGLNSYTERSPSGTGLRIFVQAELSPGFKTRQGGIECYAGKRFLTVTGAAMKEIQGHPLPCSVEPRQEALEAFLRQHLAKDTSGPVQGDDLPESYPETFSDEQILEMIRKSEQADRFASLFDEGYLEHDSHSEADLALCNILAFWCGRNPEQMDRIFREGALMRDKWDRDDYRTWTLDKAIAGCQEVHHRYHSVPPEEDFAGVAGEAGSEWEDLVPLDQPNLPRFDEGDFPPTLWSMIEAIAKATETPPELAAMNVLAAAATCCQRKMTIELNPDYTEPLALWTLTVLPSGSRKSAALGHALRPLQAWEAERGELLGPIIRAARVTREAEEQRIKSLEKAYAAETNPDKREGIMEQITAAEAALPEIPKKPRLIAQDTTTEKLGTLLADHGERMGVFSAEGGIFETLAGRYTAKGVANIDVLLQAHSGEAVRVDRGSRDPVHLKEPALSMGLSVQPDVVRAMGSNTAFRGRGLTARFLFAVPEDLVGRRTLETTPIPKPVVAEYRRVLHALLDMGERRYHQTGDLIAIRLCPDAHRVWKQFQRWVEGELAEGGSLEHQRDWGGKLPGAVGRIAGIFHCIEYASGLEQDPRETPDGVELCTHTMEQAISLAKKLVPHALHIHDAMGEDIGLQVARRILRWIRSGSRAMFTVRELHRSLRGSYPKRADLNPGLGVLLERGYIRKVRPQGVSQKGGRPSEVFEINPVALGK